MIFSDKGLKPVDEYDKFNALDELIKAQPPVDTNTNNDNHRGASPPKSYGYGGGLDTVGS